MHHILLRATLVSFSMKDCMEMKPTATFFCDSQNHQEKSRKPSQMTFRDDNHQGSIVRVKLSRKVYHPWRKTVTEYIVTVTTITEEFLGQLLPIMSQKPSLSVAVPSRKVWNFHVGPNCQKKIYLSHCLYTVSELGVFPSVTTVREPSCLFCRPQTVRILPSIFSSNLAIKSHKQLD